MQQSNKKLRATELKHGDDALRRGKGPSSLRYVRRSQSRLTPVTSRGRG